MLDACCCNAIGFDEGSWSYVTTCFPDVPIRTQLITNIADINSCKLIFIGNNVTCGEAIRFTAGDSITLADWVKAGGRLFISGEHSGNHPASGTSFKCLQDMSDLNDFLSNPFILGSTIQYTGFDYNASTPSCSAGYYTPGTAAIAAGLTFPGARFGEITGGTSLWLGPAGTGGTGSGAGKIAAAIERIGDGFVVVSGDSDHSCALGTCDFLTRYYEWDTANII